MQWLHLLVGYACEPDSPNRIVGGFVAWKERITITGRHEFQIFKCYERSRGQRQDPLDVRTDGSSQMKPLEAMGMGNNYIFDEICGLRLIMLWMKIVVG